jgi:uncharacterized protein YehS (DUF1456 family)
MNIRKRYATERNFQELSDSFLSLMITGKISPRTMREALCLAGASFRRLRKDNALEGLRIALELKQKPDEKPPESPEEDSQKMREHYAATAERGVE